MAPRRVISAVMMLTGGKIEVMMMVKIGVIEVLMMANMDLGINRPATLLLSIWKKLFIIIIGDVDIGPRPAAIPTITQVTMVYCFVYMFVLVILMIFFMTM